MTAPAVDAPIVPDDAPPAPTASSGWRGPIMPINQRSGDGRIMVLDESITEPPCRPLPLPLSAQRHVDEGHDGAIVVGLIRRVWLQDGHVWAEGTFNDDEDGREWAARVANGQRWISADLSDIQAEEIPLDEHGAEVDVAAADVALDLEVESLIRVTAWKLMGATLVAGPAFESAHIEAAEVEPSGLTASLIAAGIAYDPDDFADPRLGELTALQVTDDGRVFGHLAGFRSCHIGFQGACVTAPSSASGYRYFHQGAVRLADGRDLPVGKLTLGTGHAPTRPGVGASAAAAHYDNTGSAVAVVRAGEDMHGIWVAGRVLPGVSEQRVDELRRSGISGDWRTVTPGGGLELVAALAVNVPGFPIPRTQSMAASGEAALVAAGIVTPATARAVDASLRRARAGVLAKRMHAIRTRDLRARMNTLKANTLRARMTALVAAPVEEDGTQLQGGQRIVRTQAGADRYGVAIGEPIPTGSARTQAVEKEWEQIKAENPAGTKKTKGSGSSKGGSGSSSKTKDTTTKGQVPSGAKKLGSSISARKADNGDPSAYMEEDEAPDEGAKGGTLTKFEAGVAYYSDGTMSDGKSWYEQGPEKTTKTSTKTSTKSSGGTTSRSTTGTKTTTSTGTPASSTAAKDPISSFVEALVNLLARKPTQTGTTPSTPAGPEESGPTPEQRQRLQSLLDRLQTQLDDRERQDRQRAITAAGQLRGRMNVVRAASLRTRMMVLARERWPKGTPGGLGGKFKPGDGASSGTGTAKKRETRAAALKRTTTEFEDAIAKVSADPSPDNLAAFDKAEAALNKADAAHRAEKARAQARRDKIRQGKQDEMDKLIEKGWNPDEAEAEAFGRPIERIRRRDTIAMVRSGADGSGGTDVKSFEQAVRVLHTQAMIEQIAATEGGTVMGYRLKEKYANMPEAILWTANEQTARKYMTPEMGEWFDQNGRVTRQMIRDSALAGRLGMYDTSQQGWFQ